MILKPFVDVIPSTPFDRTSLFRQEAWVNTGGAKIDRDWRGEGIGCYHGTNDQGRAVLCEGHTCKVDPKRCLCGYGPDCAQRNARKSSARKPTGPSDSAIPSKTTRTGRWTDVDAFIRSTGYAGRITPSMRRRVEDGLIAQGQISEMCEA